MIRLAGSSLAALLRYKMQTIRNVGSDDDLPPVGPPTLCLLPQQALESDLRTPNATTRGGIRAWHCPQRTVSLSRMLVMVRKRTFISPKRLFIFAASASPK